MRSRNLVYLCAIGMTLSGCGTKLLKPSDQHLQRSATQPEAENSIPQPIQNSVVLPPPKPADKIATYSVVVTNVPAQQILFALARDAKINLDIQSGIQGTVTVNAINQTLPQILDRISNQVDIRYKLDNGTLIVKPDKPYLKTYKIDFINMSRTVDNMINTSSQLGGTSGGSTGGTSGGSTGGTSGNTASTKITSTTKNDLMESLIQNVKDIILDEDKLHFQERADLQSSNMVSARGTGSASGSTSFAAPKGSGGTEINQASKGGSNNRGNSGTGGSVSGSGNQDVQGQGAVSATKGVYERAVNVFANKETGVLIVRATSRQHAKVQEFIDKVMSAASQQVLIEATIAEVTLSREYQQGINWSHLFPGAKGIQLTQLGAGVLTAANTGSMITLKNANLSASVSLLESFGTVKVLSSPKLSVMNNQTATLKVVDNKVYFTVSGTVTPATATSAATSNFTSTATTIAVGFVMNVTPEISDAGSVTMNVRPTISRITGYVNDPNPSLASPCGNIAGSLPPIPAGCDPIVNRVPEIQTREMESIIKIDSGQIAVLGGLMQDSINKQTDGVPLLADIPLLGNLFKYRNDATQKTELVIFIRPTVIKNASVDGDFNAFRSNLPDQNFFKESAYGKP